MEKPVVNVLMPTYEPNPQYLVEALDSLLAQTEERWTLFMHDDASKVDVRSMIETYLQDPRITFERSEKNLGIGGNWNACRSGISAPYIQYLFQDDMWHPEHLEKAIKVLGENPSVGFVSMDHKYQYEGDVPVDRYQALKTFKEKEVDGGLHHGEEFLVWWVRRELHPNVIGEPPFVLFRRSLLESVGPFCEDMPQFLDVEYWIRCLRKSDWYYLKEDIGTFRVHPEAASARNTESGAGLYDRLRCIEQLIHSLPKGELKTEAVAARNRALTGMVQKYFGRMKGGKSVSTGGKGGSFLRKFCLRHPLLMAYAFIRALTHKLKAKAKVPEDFIP